MKYSGVRGFNYQPSYGSTSFENWINFDPEIIELELRRGKEFFPVMNTVRLWLSWPAFVRNPQKFMADFEKALAICDRVKVCSQTSWAYPEEGQILLIHPYFMAEQDDQKAKKEFYNLLDDYLEVSERADKPLLVTETCWGSLDNQWRVENIKFTLKELKKRNIGWLAHALHYSLVADLHYPEDGPVEPPGNLAFIEKDGSLREGHGVFNEF